MTKTIKFAKMHGLGNDFVIIDQQEISSISDIANFATNIADRRLGIGCDQLIIYKKLATRHYQMYIYNQDGSYAKACGNGTRCLSALIDEPNLVIQVEDRLLQCRKTNDNNIEVNMGQANFTPSWIPEKIALWGMLKQYHIEPKEVECVEIGNPHIIIFNQSLTQQDKAIIGKNFEYHKLFSGGVNVNFATIENNEIKLQVWERGDGFTLACGSGACATFAAALKHGYVNKLSSVKFEHGSLDMSITDDNDIIMSGPTKLVAVGEFVY